jgi:hypothetical protein
VVRESEDGKWPCERSYITMALLMALEIVPLRDTVVYNGGSGMKRNIITNFYNYRNELVKANCSSDRKRATARALFHLVTDRYPTAKIVEVFERTGSLYSVIKRTAVGKIMVIYERN